MKGTATLLRIGLLTVGVLGFATVAWACDKQPGATACSGSTAAATPTDATPAESATTPAPAEAGMRAYLDPETGVIGAPPVLPPLTEEEAAALLPEVLEEPVETVLPDGSVMLDLKGRGQEYFILQQDANGQRVVRCVQDPKAALQAAPTSQPQDR